VKKGDCYCIYEPVHDEKQRPRGQSAIVALAEVTKTTREYEEGGLLRIAYGKIIAELGKVPFETVKHILGQGQIENVKFGLYPLDKGAFDAIAGFFSDYPGRSDEYRKYGGGGEQEQHKRLKNWVAKNPHELGLDSVVQVPGKVEYKFCSGDRADILFELHGSRFAVVEVEIDNAEPGSHQALKYKTLLCAEKWMPLDSNRVLPVLVAYKISSETKEFCRRYGIRWYEKDLANV
jgi:hypothetical protein